VSSSSYCIGGCFPFPLTSPFHSTSASACGGCYFNLFARCLPSARPRPPCRALPVVLTRSFILYCGRLLVLSSSRPPCRRRRFRYCCDVISPPKLYYRNTARASTVLRISVLGSSVVAQYQINGIRRRLQLLATTSPPPTQVPPFACTTEHGSERACGCERLCTRQFLGINGGGGDGRR
jgi:hypothetical protein